MKWTRWTRFAWDLRRFAPAYPAVDPRYQFRAAAPADEKSVRAVVLSAFTLDSNWAFLANLLKSQLEAVLDTLFLGEKSEKADPEGLRPFCLVVTHGTRIIGASVLTARRDADNHLLTGPSILVEYHNRGLATALLAHSLQALKEAGVQTAYGRTIDSGLTAQFIYSKFGSTRIVPPEDAPDQVAS